eukprot:g24368.t1
MAYIWWLLVVSVDNFCLNGSLGLVGVCKAVRSLPSLEAFNAVIHLFEKAGAWDAALRAFSTMQDFSVEPNRVSVNSVISACEKSRRWRVKGVGSIPLQEDGNADEVSYNAAISALEKSGQWQYTLLLLEQMLSPDQNEVLPDQVSFNAAIGACAKEEHWEGALSLFALMQSRQIQADEITYNCLARTRREWSEWSVASCPPGSLRSFGAVPS